MDNVTMLQYNHYYITENKRNRKLKTISILITWGNQRICEK